MTRLDEHATDQAIRNLLDSIRQGQTVALTSDAGTPVISDPGARLVDLAYSHGITVDAIPGPSAVTNGIALAGFYAQQFAFLGFIPKKRPQAARVLQAFQSSPLTLVLFETHHRIEKTLALAHEVLGDRRAALCREMTKLHQQVLRNRLSQLAQIPPNVKGEITVVIEGYRRNLET